MNNRKQLHELKELITLKAANMPPEQAWDRSELKKCLSEPQQRALINEAAVKEIGELLSLRSLVLTAC